MISKEKELDDRERLEKAIVVACQEIPNITEEMFVEAKILRHGQIIADLRRENEELQACTVHHRSRS